MCELQIILDNPRDKGADCGQECEAIPQIQSRHVADGLHRVGAGVDDGQHGGDDPEEDGGHHGGDGSDVELIDHQLALMVHHPLRAWNEMINQNIQKLLRCILLRIHKTIKHNMNNTTEMQPKDVPS